MNRARFVILFLGAIIIILEIVRITLDVNIATTADIEYTYIAKEIERLQKENMQINTKILREESLLTIREKAKERGFVEVSNFIYLK